MKLICFKFYGVEFISIESRAVIPNRVFTRYVNLAGEERIVFEFGETET